jgi:hypothetical protein
MSTSVGFQECQHDESVSSARCEQHRGWCGVCRECGGNVHAPDDVFMLTGREVYRESKLHGKKEA